MSKKEVLITDPLKNEDYLLLERMLHSVLRKQQKEPNHKEMPYKITNETKAKALERMPIRNDISLSTKTTKKSSRVEWAPMQDLVSVLEEVVAKKKTEEQKKTPLQCNEKNKEQTDKVSKNILQSKDNNSNTIEEKSYETIREYGNAIFDYINRTIKNHGYQVVAKSVCNNVRALYFDTSLSRMRADSRVLFNFQNCTYTIELVICRGLPGRMALVEYLIKNESPKSNYGSFVTDKTMEEVMLTYSSGCRGSFSIESFEKRFIDLLMTCRNLCQELPQ